MTLATGTPVCMSSNIPVRYIFRQLHHSKVTIIPLHYNGVKHKHTILKYPKSHTSCASVKKELLRVMRKQYTLSPSSNVVYTSTNTLSWYSVYVFSIEDYCSNTVSNSCRQQDTSNETSTGPSHTHSQTRAVTCYWDERGWGIWQSCSV